MKPNQLLQILIQCLTLGWMASAQAQTPFVDPMFEFTVKKDIVFANLDVGHPALATASHPFSIPSSTAKPSWITASFSVSRHSSFPTW